MEKKRMAAVGVRAFARAIIGMVALALSFSPSSAATEEEKECIECHRKHSPNIVEDWLASKMAKQTQKEVTCATCHGTDHGAETDSILAVTPTAATCNQCHEERVGQFKSGKHALAWRSLKSVPAELAHMKEFIEGEKGCGGCHAIGREDGQCDSCHTRHRFSRAESNKPEACLPCHMGFDHGQWEIWSSSKHGVIYRVDPESGRAPTCQTCHMPEGNHGVSTSWGYFALRLPEPDREWQNYRKSLLKGLGVLDEVGKPMSWVEREKAGKVFTISTLEKWKDEREKMVKVCMQCHAETYVREELKKSDAIVKDVDALMAEAIEIVADLYREGYLERGKDYPAFPDLMRLYEIPTTIEQKLFRMLMEHRMRAIQGAFHINPEYTLWYGWAALRSELIAVKEEAKRIREAAELRKERQK